MAKLFCLLFLGAGCAVAQTVEGTVLDAATGSGVAGVKVELLMEGWTRYDAITDGAGRFRFDKVKEGDYTDRYQSADHWLTAGWADCHAFHVAAGSPVNLETRLMPWSKISGRVVDPKGNGVANAPLELTGSGMTINGRTYMRTSWGGGGGGQLGQAPLAMPFRGQTDAHGKFEVQLMPGTYGLSVVPPPALKPPDPGEDGAPLVWTRTYYPGVDAAEAASKIVVFPGSDVSGVELKLFAVSPHAVRGVLLNPDETPAPKVAITMADGPRSVQVVSEPDGTFEFPSVVEGEWRLLAQAESNSVKLRAVEWIEVSKRCGERETSPRLAVDAAGEGGDGSSKRHARATAGAPDTVAQRRPEQQRGRYRRGSGSAPRTGCQWRTRCSGCLSGRVPSWSAFATNSVALLPGFDPGRRRGFDDAGS